MELSQTTASADPASARVSTPSEGKTGISSDFETFLKMLTAQIQNQDPLNPTPSDEFAVQLATFSSVEQQVLTNDLLKGLGGQFSTMGMAQFAGWVGMEGRAAAPVLFSGDPITLSPVPEDGADSTQLVVRDGNGREIERKDLPATPNPIEWTGLGESGAPYLHGVYSFELVSFSEGNPIGSSTVHAYSKITEVRGDAEGTVLILEGGAEVPASDVTALRQPSA